jgi:microcompartment protein CcmL/EutN
MTPSIGIIETKSIAASAEILNRILKSSKVELINIEYPGNGSVTVFLSGEYSQMKNSLATVEKISSEFQIQLISRIITKPDDKLFGLIGIHNEIPVKIKSASVLEIKERENKIDEEKFIETSPISEKNQEALEAVNVIEKQENAQPIKSFAKRIMVETVKGKKKAVNKDKPAGVTDSDAIPIKVRTDNPTIAKLRMEALGKKNYVEPESEIKLVAESQNENGPLSLEQLQGLNVHKLRRYARNFSSFPIKGREISRANRDELLNYFKELL